MTATAKCLWDDQYLYIGIAAVGGFSATNGEKIELYLDPSNARPHYYTSQQYKLECAQGSASCAASAYISDAVAGTSQAFAAVSGGWNFEVRLPWASLANVTATNGMMFGFDVQVNNSDAHADKLFYWQNDTDTNWTVVTAFGSAVLE
jgi:hypothetical protein